MNFQITSLTKYIPGISFKGFKKPISQIRLKSLSYAFRNPIHYGRFGLSQNKTTSIYEDKEILQTVFFTKPINSDFFD